MCGIAGIFHLDSSKVNKRTLHTMDSVLVHRGPDAHGELLEGNVGLSNRRLAIIDTSSMGNQPLSDETKTFWITFNGEIFNYRDLRKELIKKGYRFKTHTDTETILYGYREYGKDIVRKLIGQFAFCIWDKKRSALFLARDHMGVNPLYYAHVGNAFLFASEVKALLASGLIKKELNTEAIYHYLSMFTIPAPQTIFSSIHSLLPGHYMMVSTKNTKIQKYWEIPIGQWKSSSKPENELMYETKELLTSAVSYAKESDVPVASFLSGGIDSSTIVALMSKQMSKPLKTFSLWSEGGEAYDERKYAKLVADKYKTDHTEFTVTEDEVVKELPNIVYYYDQPTGGSFETFFISKISAQHVKVALTGLGGDELFAGYHESIYQNEYLSHLYKYVPSTIRQSFTKNVLMNLPLSADKKKTIRTGSDFLSLESPIDQRLFLYFAFMDKEKEGLLHPSLRSEARSLSTRDLFYSHLDRVRDASLVDRLALLDLETYTRDDLLLGTNMMSMAHSLETRVPFLDQRLVELSSQIPPHLKYRNGKTKYILKEIMRDELPYEVLNHKKTGFGMPRVSYMRGKLRPHIERILYSKTFKNREIFNDVEVRNLVETFYKDTSNKMLWREHLRIWILFIFELWCRLYIDTDKLSEPSVSLKDL